MIKIHQEFNKHKFKSKMLLQVRRMVFDAHKSELQTVKPVILQCMQTALALPTKYLPTRNWDRALTGWKHINQFEGLEI